MTYVILKVIISAVIIVSIAEISKRNALLGAMIASLPVVSVLALTWLYIDTKNTQKIIELSKNILILIIPSLSFFVFLIVLLKKEINYYLSLSLSLFLMVSFYFITVRLLKALNITS
ncbi:DUF3147 family protein [Candidatus Nucleicultrix amoebiphila]|jgi:hypothetical protein|uniref:DUF3147 family protein n=1 Tax=Candidatus Nucleicultrix amoebiphila FS5 TaxID=1414854 RepID=A0A1W6N568_9PROT|nr:DUF3147 family protein [Candidatus Nucleicultrix amoebiphila]ARN85015.1 hypothetical protein GQ61_06610 [Candidatus Nucleicultrix amoebiphila FS5]